MPDRKGAGEKKKMPPAPQIPVVQGLRSDENILGRPYEEDCAPPSKTTKQKQISQTVIVAVSSFLTSIFSVLSSCQPSLASHRLLQKHRKGTMAKALCRVQHIGGLTRRGLQSQTGLSVFMILYLSPRS